MSIPFYGIERVHADDHARIGHDGNFAVERIRFVVALARSVIIIFGQAVRGRYGRVHGVHVLNVLAR